jgi:hypothetical protein
MACGITDRDEERFAFTARLVERLVAPGKPVNGIVRVMLEVRALRVDQTIGLTGLAVDDFNPDTRD